MSVLASFQRDQNFVPITGLGFIESKSITFAAGTTGAIGTTTLFNVSGKVALNVFGYCTADLAGTGTISLGVAGATAALADAQTATSIDNHEVWHDAVLAVGGQVAGHWHIVDQSVIQTIASNTVSGGSMTYFCGWIPLEEGATVTAA